MAVSFTDTPGSTLPSTSEPIDFFVSTDPAEVTVSVKYGNGTWEMVYQDGEFAGLFSGSVRVGQNFTVVRNGGWPLAPEVRVKEASAVAGSSKTYSTVGGFSSGQYYNLSSGTPPSITSGAFSWGALVCPRSLAFNTGMYFGHLDNSGGGNLYLNSSGQILSLIQYNSGFVVTPSYQFVSGDLDKLHAVVLTVSSRSAGAVASLYVDSALIGTATCANAATINSSQVRLGTSSGGVAQPNMYFGGGFYASSYAMTLSDVQAWATLVKANGFPTPPSLPVTVTGYLPPLSAASAADAHLTTCRVVSNEGQTVWPLPRSTSTAMSLFNLDYAQLAF